MRSLRPLLPRILLPGSKALTTHRVAVYPGPLDLLSGRRRYRIAQIGFHIGIERNKWVAWWRHHKVRRFHSEPSDFYARIELLPRKDGKEVIPAIERYYEAGTHTTLLDLQDVSSGLYVLVLDNNNGQRIPGTVVVVR